MFASLWQRYLDALSQNYHLFILGSLAFAAAYRGRRFAGRYDPRTLRLHIACMGSSYVLMLTAFYVDNGRNLPLWRELPDISLWIIPAAFGVPLIVRAMLRHRLVRARNSAPKRDCHPSRDEARRDAREHW